MHFHPMRLSLVVAAALAASGAHAVDRPLWELGAGVGGLHLPHYRGADQSHDLALPVPYVIYRGRFLKADREGARAVLYESRRVDFDLSLAASPPTRSRNNEARAGMADLSPTVELGPNMNWTLARGTSWKVDVRVPVRAAFTVERSPRAIGWLASPNVNLDLQLPDGWRLGLLTGPLVATKRFHGYYYDVSPAEATATRPAYDARGGYSGARVLGALSRRFAGGFAGAFVRWDTLQGAVFADSPLVRRRSNISFGVAYAWVFATSAQRVESEN